MEASMKMPKYEAYKGSGFDWLGDVPSEWFIKPGLVAFSENKRDNKGMKESTVLSLSYGKIVIKPEEKLVGLVPESFETYQLVEPSDIIVRCTDLQNDQVSLRIGLAKDRGIITSAYLNLKVKEGFDSRFLHYYLYALDTTKVLYKFGSGLRQNLSYLDFKRLPVFEIPKSLQVAIANFLDKKTTQIDEAIAIKEQQIALLKERKQIIIQKAVTQGLHPNVPMKDSGMDWIGKIPAHWDIESFKNILTERNEKNDPIKSRERLSLSIDKGITLYAEKTTNLDRFKDDFKQYKLAHESDLVFNSMNMIVGAVGVSNYFGCVSPVYYTYYSQNENPKITKYYESLFRSRIVQSQLFCLGKGIMAIDRGDGKFNTVRLKVSRDDLRSMKVPCPTNREIVEIVDHIEAINIETSKAIDLNEQQIEKLKEYKITLINSVVTGKIKVTPEMAGLDGNAQNTVEAPAE